MLQETFEEDVCFPNVSRFCYARNLVSRSKMRFCFTAETNSLFETLLVAWQNWETLGKHASASNVSGSLFPGFARPLLGMTRT